MPAAIRVESLAHRALPIGVALSVALLLGVAFCVRVLRYDPSIRHLPSLSGGDRFSSSTVLLVFEIGGTFENTKSS